jgi:hypothetical protein
MPDLETIDSELRLLVAIRRLVREEEGRVPSTRYLDELLDERAAAEYLLSMSHKRGRKLLRAPRIQRACGSNSMPLVQSQYRAQSVSSGAGRSKLLILLSAWVTM